MYIREQIDLEELTENALQQSEQLYRTLVENVNLGITLIDNSHTILMANAEQLSQRASHEKKADFIRRAMVQA